MTEKSEFRAVHETSVYQAPSAEGNEIGTTEGLAVPFVRGRDCTGTRWQNVGLMKTHHIELYNTLRIGHRHKTRVSCANRMSVSLTVYISETIWKATPVSLFLLPTILIDSMSNTTRRDVRSQ